MTLEHLRFLVLVVDDDEANLLLLTRIFAKLAHIEIVTESVGNNVLGSIRQRKPDLVLLDLNLAELSGELILKQMRTNEETTAIPVVIVSGDVSEVTKRRLREAGAQGYLEKPYTIGEVIALVDSFRDSAHHQDSPV
jgi:CheY-like chemotaxis protein